MSRARQGVCILAVVWLCAASAVLAADAEWPWWRGPKRDGKSPDTGLLKEWPAGGPKKLWQADGIGQGFSTVAVSGGRIYTTGDTGGRLALFALDMDGKPLWKREIDAAYTRSHPGSRSTPTVDGERLYLLSGNGVIACRSAKTGKPVWTKNTKDFGGSPGGWGYAESVLILGKYAFVKPGGSKCIVALDKATGRALWTSSGFQAGPEYSSCFPFRHDGKVIVATGTRAGIVCVDPRSGKLLWSDPWSANNTANCPDPVYADGFVFWANGYGKGGVGMRLKGSGSSTRADRAWTTRDMDCHHGGYIVHDGYIYGNNGGRWACLDLKTGKTQWNESGVGKGSCCWADGMLYLFSESHGKAGLATCSPDGLEMKGTFSVEGRGPSWAHPVVIGGRLYLRYDSHLYCFDVKAP